MSALNPSLQASTDTEPGLPAAQTPSAATRLEFLDALRGIAALLVVIQHVGERYISWIPSFTETWFNFGRFGVTIFFLVSGFVIPYAFEKDSSVRSFWIKRFFRLYPLYWLALALSVTLQIEPAGFRGPRVTTNLIANVSMLQGFFGIPNASAPFWTLFIEMAFYIAFTVWFLMRLQKRSMLWASLGAIAFFAVSVLAPLLLGAHAPVTKLFCFLAILVGSVFYRAYTGQVKTGSLTALLTTVLLTAGAAAYLNFFKFPSSEQISATSVLASWVLAFLFFAGMLALRGKQFPATLLWLGRISYSLYLLHAVVLDSMPDVGSKGLGFALVLSISVVLSVISFLYLERPFVSIGHRVATSLKAATA